MTDPTLPTLPGEAAVDDALVADVVARLNTTLHKNGLETAMALGRIVLDAFFAGDPASFHSREKKHMSFRRLAQREDLQLSHTALWSSVALVEQLAQLPHDVGGALTLSHHRVLLGLRDPDAKLDLARQAVAEQLSRRALAERVRLAKRDGHPPGRGGRRPQPAFIKAIKQLDAAVATAAAGLPTPEIVRAWGPDRARAALAAAQAHLAELTRLIDTIGATVAAADPDPDA